MAKRQSATLTQQLIINEFLRLERENQERLARGEPELAILPKDMASRLAPINVATIRGVLNNYPQSPFLWRNPETKEPYWDEHYRKLAATETWGRINESKARNGFPSLAKQRDPQTGRYTYLDKGRAKWQMQLAESDRERAEASRVRA